MVLLEREEKAGPKPGYWGKRKKIKGCPLLSSVGKKKLKGQGEVERDHRKKKKPPGNKRGCCHPKRRGTGAPTSRKRGGIGVIDGKRRKKEKRGEQ